MHKPYDGGEEDVHFLRQEQGSQDTIIFGDGNHGMVGLGKIAITTEHSISNVFLVESLGYNLLSLSVLDDKLYLFDFTKDNVDIDACLIAKTNLG
jgi:hypothetical protein